MSCERKESCFNRLEFEENRADLVEGITIHTHTLWRRY